MGKNPRLLAGKTALITGGGTGIGLDIARKLLEDGASVVLMGRDQAKLTAAATQLQAQQEGALVGVCAGDTGLEEDVIRAVNVANALDNGSLSIIVANAGTGSGGNVLNLEVESWNEVLKTNVTGPMLLIKHGGRVMCNNGKGGSICGISSIAGVMTHRLMTSYCVSKAALEMLIRQAADELGEFNIRVNAVRPGLVPTPLSTGLHTNKHIVADYQANMPLTRLGTTTDVASGVRYLVGPESDWVTGQIFAIDGGHTLRRGPDLLAGSRGKL